MIAFSSCLCYPIKYHTIPLRETDTGGTYHDSRYYEG